MREIKYRAIDRHSGEWVYGVPFTSQENNFTDFEAMHVCDSTGYWRIFQVVPDTLCQYTGLKDRNGREIYEGDILYHPMQGKRKVYYPFTERVASYGLRMIEGEVKMANTLSEGFLYEIIGNIHDNPELLEVKE